VTLEALKSPETNYGDAANALSHHISGVTPQSHISNDVQLAQLFSCSMCAIGHLCECENMRNLTPLPPITTPVVESSQAQLSIPSASTQFIHSTISSSSSIPSTSTGQGMQLFNPDSSMIPYTKPDVGRRVTRKCVRCKCPNCISGQKGTSDKPKQHICHIPSCGKVYGKTSHLKAHLLYHAGQRPFVCNWRNCNRSFTRSDELQRHLRTHTGEKRFACDECGKRFTRSDHLSKHMQTHKKNKEVKK